MATPTIETEAYRAGAGFAHDRVVLTLQRESTTIREKLSQAMLNRDHASPDQTAELSLDDLGLDLDQLPDAEQAALEETDHPCDAATMVAGLDEKSRRALRGSRNTLRARAMSRPCVRPR